MGFTNGMLTSRDIAIVHDYLNQRGGAERVVLELSQMFPHAPIYTSLYRPDSTFPGFRDRDIRASPLDRIPVDDRFRDLFPLYPMAFRTFGPIDADVVLASSSGWAHLARSSARALHVVYCYTPARWLYGGEYLNGGDHRSRRQQASLLLRRPLRRLDRRAAERADLYIATCENVRGRIHRQYGLEAEVIPPPVDLDRFRPSSRGERLLVISRLLPYKHVELVVSAATRMGVGLDVVGDGPLRSDLQGLAGPTVEFHGAASDKAVAELLDNCNAVCVAAEEDFGIVPIEAQASGKPVVAYGRGGALETVDDGFSGIFFHEQTEEDLIAAIRQADELTTPPQAIAARAQRFSAAAFRVRLASVLEQALARREEGAPLRELGAVPR